MAGDVITLITADHRRVEALLSRLGAERGERRATVAELHALLTAHARAEEDRVYPGIDAHHGLEEHKEAEILLDALRRAEAGSAEFEETLELLAGTVVRHIRDEETTMLPLLARTAGDKRLKRLGAAFAERRQQVLRALAAAGDGQVTRADLYERARRADLPGRSRMTKPELEAALDQAAQ
ncbi:hemerythrin domain-containing protein [Nonomuraea sp. SBT364]|uniref:hemerythrin domain-containing protein n=1 Tax=Nonomuraea sp. SBT364 TaxID=1580530 RepID=UPI00066D83C7|nr:hemerythrin domain-containing protein [Nonomuraea sp. SBT364]